MKVYVGAKYCEKGAAKRLMKVLKAQGHKVTVDWTQHTKVDKESLALYATEDVKGVQRCNAAIFIMERPHKYKGCFVEMGVALGKGHKVIIIGHAGDSCVFVDHPKVMVIKNMEEFLRLPLKSWMNASKRPFLIGYVPHGSPLPFTNVEDCKTVNCKFEDHTLDDARDDYERDKLEPQEGV
jgi:hypothetical protein